jgi:hypothetical protein
LTIEVHGLIEILGKANGNRKQQAAGKGRNSFYHGMGILGINAWVE